MTATVARSKLTAVRLAPAEFEGLRAFARAQETTVSAVVRDALSPVFDPSHEGAEQ